MVLAAASTYAVDDWGNVAMISSTMGVSANRICIGEGLRSADIGCPTYAPSITTAGDVSVTGNLSAAKFIGDGSGLTGVASNLSETIFFNDLADVSASNVVSTMFVGVGVGNNKSVSTTTAMGSGALQQLTTGFANTIYGSNAGNGITSGNSNVAFGYRAMMLGTSGLNNIAIGSSALLNINSGSRNIGIGNNTGSNVLFSDGIAIGDLAGYRARLNQTITIGSNAAYGDATGFPYISRSVIIGHNAGTILSNTTNNILIGYNAGSTLFSGSNNILIGTSAAGPTSGTSSYLNIGNTLFANMTGSSTIGGSTKVGVNWITPTVALEVSGTISATNLVVNGQTITGGSGDRITSGTSSVVVNSATSTISFSTAGSQRMTIDGSGNVGIGTAAPGSQLDISGGGGNSADQLRMGMGANYYKIGRNISTGYLDFTGTQTGFVGYTFSGGSVGIGTTAPAQTLSVSGTAQIASSTAIGMTATPSATLDISGTLKIAGTGSEGCNGDTVGMFRRNPVTRVIQVCR